MPQTNPTEQTNNAETTATNAPHNMNYIYALETLFMRIFVKPLFHLMERVTGYSCLDVASGIGLGYAFASMLSEFIAWHSMSVTFKHHLDAARCAALPVMALSVYYSWHVLNIVLARNAAFHEAPTKKSVTDLKFVIHDPKRLFWCLTAIGCIAIMYRWAASYPFIFYLLLPFCGFGQILVLCGIRPYYSPAKEAQRRKNKKVYTTMTTLMAVGFAVIQLIRHPENSIERTLLLLTCGVVYGFVLNIIWRKDPRSESGRKDGSVD